MSLDEVSVTPPTSPSPMKTGDVTPPVSPFLMTMSEEFEIGQEEDFLSEMPQSVQNISTVDDSMKKVEPFRCDVNKTSRTTSCSYMERLMLTNKFLTSVDCVACPELPPLTELFGFQFDSSISVTDMDKLFLLFRQCLGRFEVNMSTESESSKLQSMREDFVNFMEHLKSIVIRLDVVQPMDHDSLISSLISQLHNSLLYMDSLSEILYEQEYVVSKVAFHKFHLCLDLYWNTLEVIHIMTTKCTDVPCYHQISRCVQVDISDQANSLFSKILKMLLWELILLSKQRYNKLTLKEAPCTPIHTCNCVNNIWSLIISLLHHRQNCNSEESFWIQIHYIIQSLQNNNDSEENMEIDSDVYLYPCLTKIKGDNSNFCLWLLTNLAMIEVSVVEDKNTKVPGNYYDVISILKQCLNKGEVTETLLRYYLLCCIQLTDMWGPNMELVVLFWDYYFKRLNTSFQLSSSTVDGLASMSKSARGLLELCNHLGNKDFKEKPQDSSYHLYLVLMCSHLRRMLDRDSTREWKQMKGRIYSKFHQRRMQELSEIGLYNFTCLFVCLALTAHLEDVTGKLFDFYDMVEVSGHRTGKKIVIWKGMFAIVMLYCQKQLDVSFIAEKLQKDFSSICLKFSSSSDSGEHHHFWKVINFYFESMQEVFESSGSLSFSEHKLLGEGFSEVMTSCRNHELQTTLTTLQAIISRFRLVFTGNNRNDVIRFQNYQAMYRRIWDNVYPSMKELCNSLTASPHLADILADLCLAAKDCNRQDFISLMKFVTGDRVNKGITCRFLSHVLPVEGVMLALSEMTPDYQTMLVKIWIRCSIFVSPSSPQLLTLNRCMLHLDDIKSTFTRSGADVPTDGDKTAIRFFQALQMTYSRLQGWKEKIDLRDKALSYFKDVHSDILPVLQTLRPVDTLSNIYTLVGSLIKFCSPLLFVQSKPDCPLPNIINSMIVPHNLFNPEKPVSPVFISVVRDTLHLFVRGLASLDYKKAPYVQRQLRNIVTIYLPKYTTSSSFMLGGATVSVHPLVVSLKDSYRRQPTEDSINFRQCILDIVKDNFLQNNQYMLPNNYQLGVTFVHDVINRTTNKTVLARDAITILQCMMGVLLLSDVISCQQTTLNIIKQLMESCEQNTHIVSKVEVCSVIETFISSNQKLHLDGVIKTLQKCCTFGRQFIKDVIPRLQHIVVEHESHRGVGVDNKLRQSLVSLIKSIGRESSE